MRLLNMYFLKLDKRQPAFFICANNTTSLYYSESFVHNSKSQTIFNEN